VVVEHLNETYEISNDAERIKPQ